MQGPGILARFLDRPGPADKYGNRWQYHSRSDRHSKVGSWGVALDLLATSSLLRRHVEDGKVVLGVNHTPPAPAAVRAGTAPRPTTSNLQGVNKSSP